MSAHHRQLDESDIVLIERVRDTPSLYDHRHGDFRLMQRKAEDWAKVASTLNISSADARRRWTCLRDRYSRELKQMRLHPRSEFGRNEFFLQMDFLREFVRRRKERSRRDDTPTWIKDSTSAMLLKAERHDYDGSEHNYDDSKSDGQTLQSDAYSVLVEADDGHESYAEYIGETGTPDQPESESAQADETNAASPTAQADINYVVCMPNVTLERNLPQQSPSAPAVPLSSRSEQLHTTEQKTIATATPLTLTNETEDDFFCKSVAAYLRQLSRRHKIKAKVEMYQILEKYIEIEETTDMSIASPDS